MKQIILLLMNKQLCRQFRIYNPYMDSLSDIIASMVLLSTEEYLS
uniref:Uncharacterized protein n=1 Tax=Arundo donax TaxID=35708 RepID=A0A0A9DEA3_ARUDO